VVVLHRIALVLQLCCLYASVCDLSFTFSLKYDRLTVQTRGWLGRLEDGRVTQQRWGYGCSVSCREVFNHRFTCI